MAITFQRKSLWFLVVGLLVFGAAGFNEVRAAAGDRIVIGVVTESGRGSFVLRTPTGEFRTFNTGRETKYQPADFRVREGDQVEVTFYNKDFRGRIIQAVSHLKLIRLNPDFREPPNPAFGTIREAGHRAFDIYIPAINLAWKFEVARVLNTIPPGWTPLPGDEVIVAYDKVPSRWSGAPVYVIKTMTKK